MTKISKSEVEHIAVLARLRIPEEQIEMFTGQMNRILGYMDKLGELDTENVEPTSHATDLPTPWREDVVIQSPDPEEALENAPESKAGFIIVPKVIDG